MSESSDRDGGPGPDDTANEAESDERREQGLVESERAATHRATEDVAPGAIKDGHGEIQPDPYPDPPGDAGDDDPDREVIEQHRADAHAIEHHRSSAANEALGTVTEQGEPDADRDTTHE